MTASDCIRVASTLIIDKTAEDIVEYPQSVIEIRCSLSSILGERHAPLSQYSLPLEWSEDTDFVISRFNQELAHTIWISSPVVIESSSESGKKHFFLKKKL